MNGKILALLAVGAIVVAGCAVPFLLKDSKQGAPIEMELQIYGNANGDWKIDSNDADYLRGIMSGEKSVTKYADANRDGVIDQKDIDQVNALADNSAEYIWLVDGYGRDIKVNRDIKRVACEMFGNIEMMLILGLKDKIVAVDKPAYELVNFYFGSDASRIVNLGPMPSPNFEFLEEQNLDVLLTFNWTSLEVKTEKLPDVDVIYLGMYAPNAVEPENSTYVQGVLKAGYIFGVEKRAEEYIRWYLDTRNKIVDVTSQIPDSEKKRVLMTGVNQFRSGAAPTTNWTVATSIDAMGQACILAGGYSIGKDVLTPEMYAGGPTKSTWSVGVNPEKIAVTKIDYVFSMPSRISYSGSVNTEAPLSGYTVTDPTTMKAFQELAQSHELIEDAKVYIFDQNFREAGTGALLLAAYMAKVLYPDKFKNMDPLDIHNEYVAFMGIKNFDAHKDCLFMYPVPN